MANPNLQKLKGNADAAIDLSDATLTVTLKLSDGSGATLGTLTNDTIGTTPEDGFLSIDIAGTTYKVPFWADNA